MMMMMMMMMMIVIIIIILLAIWLKKDTDSDNHNNAAQSIYIVYKVTRFMIHLNVRTIYFWYWSTFIFRYFS